MSSGVHGKMSFKSRAEKVAHEIEDEVGEIVDELWCEKPKWDRIRRRAKKVQELSVKLLSLVDG